MMMIKNSLLSIMMIVIIFIGLGQTVPLKRQQGQLVYAVFEKVENDPSRAVVGRVTFIEIPDGITRVMAQFNGGFTSVDVNDYEFLLGDRDLSSDFRELIV